MLLLLVVQHLQTHIRLLHMSSWRNIFDILCRQLRGTQCFLSLVLRYMHAANGAMWTFRWLLAQHFCSTCWCKPLCSTPCIHCSFCQLVAQWCALLRIDSTGYCIITPAMCAAVTVDSVFSAHVSKGLRDCWQIPSITTPRFSCDHHNVSH